MLKNFAWRTAAGYNPGNPSKGKGEAMRHIRVALVAKVDRDKDVLIQAIKNSRIGMSLKRSLLKHVEIVGGSYVDSKESLGEFGADLVKLGKKIQEIAGS